jgi:hypothetical protein
MIGLFEILDFSEIELRLFYKPFYMLKIGFIFIFTRTFIQDDLFCLVYFC